MTDVHPTGNERFFDEDSFIVSKTDLKGNITYGNRLFIEMTGYRKEELIGAPHNIIRHPDMPASVFALLWDTIRGGEEINAYVINLAKDGSHYWVYANITPSYDEEGKVIGYHSIRRAPKKEVVEAVKGLYQQMLSAEKTGGVEAGVRVLEEFLKPQGLTYAEFVLTL